MLYFITGFVVAAALVSLAIVPISAVGDPAHNLIRIYNVSEVEAMALSADHALGSFAECLEYLPSTRVLQTCEEEH